MKSGFKLLLVTLPIALTGLGFLVYTVKNKPGADRIEIAERVTAVRVVRVKNQSVAPRASGFGLVEPARTFDAIAQVGGTAEYVNPLLKKGDILPAGAVILRLSQADFRLAVAQARANIRAAEGKLAEITVSGENLQSALEIEKQSLEISQKDLARVEKLHMAGTASLAALDAARSKHLQQRQKVQSLASSLALLPTQRLVQTEQIAASQAALETAELNLARTELTLPFPARVGVVSVEKGQLVRIGQIVASFDGIGTAEVEAQIPAADMQRVFQENNNGSKSIGLVLPSIPGMFEKQEINASVHMQLGQSRLEWQAKMDRISNTVDPKTGTVGVIVQVENAYAGAVLGKRPPLAKGMFVEVTIEARPIEGILIPRSALDNGKVMVVDAENRLRLLPVKTRLVQEDIALVSGGLEPDMKLVVSRPIPMIEGMLLDPREDTELMGQLALAGQEK